LDWDESLVVIMKNWNHFIIAQDEWDLETTIVQDAKIFVVELENKK